MTAMLAPEVLRRSSLFSVGSLGSEVRPKITWAKKTNDDGTEGQVLTVTDQPVFRSGTFRDSWGIQTTWEFLHIDAMILNYQHLATTGIFSEIPVRKGHGAMLDDPMNTLVGWHTGLRAEKRESKVDGIEYNYLLASYTVFEEEAAKRVAAGDWRNRSAEVGYFLTNAEAEHWPVYQGFAFVDIPAVEGLNGFSKSDSPSKFSIFMESEVTAVAGTPAPTTPPSPPALHNQATEPPATEPATQPADNPPAQPASPEPTTEPTAPAPDAEPPAETQPAAPEAGSGEHSAPSGVQPFRIHGQPTTDFAAVQTHIETMETVIAESTQVNRADFVSSLASDNKILASQIPDLTEFAQGLSPEQYAKWTATFAAAPSSALFGQHGADQGDNGGQPQSGGSAADAGEKDRLVGIISMHRASGKSDEKIKSTATYKRLSQIAPDEYPI